MITAAAVIGIIASLITIIASSIVIYEFIEKKIKDR